jgi:xanthine dehydrogenase accessory factor
VIETRRSHTLGRVYWTGTTQPDTGEPEGNPSRVLRATVEGRINAHANIGDHLTKGQLIAAIHSEIENRKTEITSPFPGVLRGLIRDGVTVTKGIKIGDVDARNDPSACFLVSDKALAIGGGVLEAILSKPDIRAKLSSE